MAPLAFAGDTPQGKRRFDRLCVIACIPAQVRSLQAIACLSSTEPSTELDHITGVDMSISSDPLTGPLYSLTIVIFLAAAVYFRLSNHPLNSIKGPLSARWSQFWMIRHARKGDMHRVMIQLHKKYGSLVRTGPNEVSVSEPSAIRTIYGLFPTMMLHFNPYKAYHTQALVPSFAKVIGIACGKVVVPLIFLESGTKVFTLHSEGWLALFIR
jgi:hypothetical protein